MSYLTFVPAGPSPSGLTQAWAVQGDGGDWLGSVRWFGRWRCYSFFPREGMVFERRCLRDLADFCEAETVKWRQRKKAAA